MQWPQETLQTLAMAITPATILQRLSAILFAITSVTIVRIVASDSTNPQCGLRPLHPSPFGLRIIGGKRAKVGEVPWQVFIRFSSRIIKQVHMISAGSLIDESWIVTDAHFLHPFIKAYGSVNAITPLLFVVSGVIDRNEEIGAGAQHRTVVRIIKHEGYDDDSVENDIALLQLSRPLRLDNLTQPICLARPGEDFTGRLCTTAGWGQTQAEVQTGTPNLRSVDLPIIGFEMCERLLQKVYPNRNQVIFRDTNICALSPGGGRDACAGDSGGPLFCATTGGSYLLAGITSWGDSCGKAKIPAVYTNVEAFLPWIRNKTGLKF